MLKTITNEQKEAKKASEKAFYERINKNLIELCGNTTNINTSPFSLWMKAYETALQIKFTIYEDDVYDKVKSAIRKNETNLLPPNLKQLINRNNLRVRMVSVLNPRSLNFRTNVDESSQSKELISLKV